MNVGVGGEAVQATVRPFRLLFVLALLVTLVSLLTPGEQVLAPQTEWLQAYIPGRGASLADALADVLGLAVGVAGAVLLRRRKRSAAALQPNCELPGQQAPVANGARVG